MSPARLVRNLPGFPPGTDDAYCLTWVEVEADLGGRELTITFEVERINRGLRLPCD